MRITSIAPFLFWVCLAASIDPPNPCSPDRLAFLTPVYKVHHFTLRRVENVQDYPHFDLEDEANRYSMSCSWVLDTNGEFTGRTPLKTQVLCDPQILQGYPAAAAFYYHQTNSLMITQSWVCDAKDGSWPTLIFANATMNFTTPLSCSGENCTLPEQALPSVRGTVRRPSISQPAVQRIPSSSNQGLNTVPDNETPCIGLSFSYPNWDVSELKYLPSNDSTGTEFILRNHATNISTRCSTSRSQEKTWSTTMDCKDVSDTKTEVIITNGVLSLSQTWSCPAPSETKIITFHASGSTELPPSHTPANNTTSSPSSNTTIFQIKGTLSQPLPLQPRLMIPSAQNPNCRTLSSHNPTWSIKASTSQTSYDGWTGSNQYGTLTFDLTNNANNLSMHCAASAPELNNCTDTDHGKWFDCLPTDASQFPGQPTVSTRFRFNQTNHEISLNQTWFCNEDSAHPVMFNAIVTSELPMQCSRFMSAAPLPGQESNSEQIRCGIGKTSNPFLGQIIVIDCSMTETTTLTTSTINTTPLQPYSISERKPSGQSCTIASVLAPRWTIHVGSLSMVTNWYALGSGYDSLRMRAYVDMHVSSYADKTIYVHADSREMVPFRTETDPGKWYPCTDVGWRPERIDCSWQMDFVNGYLALNHSWVCSDKDPENPILFTAVGSAQFNTSCEYSYSHNNNGSSIHCDGVLKESQIVYPTFITNNSTTGSN